MGDKGLNQSTEKLDAKQNEYNLTKVWLII
jgi:hypothetical protein